MSKAAMADRPRKGLSPLAQKSLDIVGSVFTPMDMQRDQGEHQWDRIKNLQSKWETILDKADFLRLDGGNWWVECLLLKEGWKLRIARNLWDLSDDLGLNIPCILPPATIACLEKGANGVDMHISLPDVSGDFEAFSSKAMESMAKVYKLSKWLKERNDHVFGDDAQWTDVTLRQIIEDRAGKQKAEAKNG